MEMDNEHYPSFMEAFLVWVKVAIFSFGGPASQIAIMHRKKKSGLAKNDFCMR